MDASEDPRYVAMFQRAWAPACTVAAALVGHEQAERVTVEGFARTLERWHRLARRPDPDGKALGRTADAAVRHAKGQGVSVPLRADEVPDVLASPRAVPAGAPTVDGALRSAVTAMPRRVAVAFVLRHLGGYEDVAVASATGTSRRRAARRADRGVRILRREAGPSGHELLRG